MTVYECIAAVSLDIAQTGIAKSRHNQQQGYQFRGIDDVYNAMAPILAKHKLVIIPRILSRDVTERTAKSGGVLFNVIVEAEFDFVSATDSTKHTARTFGEAMDSADKATNKAMSAAYKYAAFQTFCIPTEGDNDADATTHEVGADKPTGTEPRPQSGGGLRVVNAKVAKEGRSAKGPWTLYAVKFSDNSEGTTFVKAIYDAAVKAFTDQQDVERMIDGKNLVELSPVFHTNELPDQSEGRPF